MHQLFVEAVEWKRVHVTIRGRIERSPEPLAPEIDSLLLRHVRTDEQVVLPPPECSESAFAVRFNVMQACDQYPLAVGDWQLYYTVAASAPMPVHIDPDLTIAGTRYGGLFSAPNYRYWVLPTDAPDSDAFCLAVNYRAIPRADIDPTKATTGLQRTIRNMRNRTYVAIYNTFRRLVRKNGRRVLFTSDSRPELSGNLQHIHERMIERGIDADYKLYTAFKPSIQAKRPFLEKLMFPYYLAVADVILLDDFHPMLYKVDFDPGVKLIQVWHASGAFKTVGYSRIGKPGGPSPFSAAHKNYTYAIVSAEHDVPFYAEAFGLPDERVIPTGIPRMDLFFDEKYKTETRELVHEAVPMTVGKKVILFAPTFRGTGPSNAYYDYDQLDLAAFHALCEELDAVCVFKMHPFVTRTARTSPGVRRSLRRCDRQPRDQRLPGRRRPGHHRLLIARLRVLDAQPPDALLRLRPRGLHLYARLLRGVHRVRPRQDRAHVR